MKKVFLSLATIAFVAAGSLTVTSCGSDDSSPVIPTPPGPGNDDNTPIDDTTPGELGENQIRIDGEVYEAQGGYFTVFGNTTTGEILGTYTWPAAELGLEEDLLVSEWSSAQVVTNGGTQYLLVTMFDVPYVVS